MSKGMSFIQIEKQFDDAMATVSSLYELMWNAEVGADLRQETIQRIGRGGLVSAKKAQRSFRDLMDLHISEQTEIQKKMIGLKKSSGAPLVERAVGILDRNKIKHIEQ